MCLIIHKPAGAEIPGDLIRNAWDDNPDGAGLMYLTADGPAVYKVMPTDWAAPSEHLIKVLAPLKDLEVGIHFRWRTHGPINRDSTHPYALGRSGGYLMHNGVLTTGPDYKPSVSDTFYYISRWLQDAPDATEGDFWRSVGHDIGHNKFLVMDRNGVFARVNEHLWSNYKGLFLSNQHSVPELANWRRSSAGAAFGTRPVRSRYWELGSVHGDSWDAEDARLSDGYKGSTAPSGLNGSTSSQDWARPLPARLTRAERRVLRDCLRVGHWGPFDRLGVPKPKTPKAPGKALVAKTNRSK